MKSTKLIAGVSALAFSALILGACSADNGGSADSSSQAASSTTVSSSAQASTEESSAANAEVTIADGKSEDAKVPAEGTVYMRQLYAAPHGDKSFAVVNVTMNGEKILSAKIDEFQYVEKTDDWKAVPNGDGAFGEAFPEGNILVAKMENSDAYSALMKDHAGSTQTWQESVTAITDFAKGKTAADLETEIAKIADDGGNVADVVSGSTFTDTRGYLQAIVDAATSGMVSEGQATTNADGLKEAMILGAPHGDKSFGVVTVAMDGGKIAATFLDEFQYTDPADFGGVPNSNGAFGEGIADGQVLASKLANNDAYSALMKDHAQATKTWQESATAIEKFVQGKTVAEIEEAAGKIDDEGKNVADVVSGATFTDAKGYLQLIVDAANEATK